MITRHALMHMHVHVSPLKHYNIMNMYNVFGNLERCQKKETLCAFCLCPKRCTYSHVRTSTCMLYGLFD